MWARRGAREGQCHGRALTPRKGMSRAQAQAQSHLKYVLATVFELKSNWWS